MRKVILYEYNKIEERSRTLRNSVDKSALFQANYKISPRLI